MDTTDKTHKSSSFILGVGRYVRSWRRDSNTVDDRGHSRVWTGCLDGQSSTQRPTRFSGLVATNRKNARAHSHTLILYRFTIHTHVRWLCKCAQRKKTQQRWNRARCIRNNEHTTWIWRDIKMRIDHDNTDSGTCVECCTYAEYLMCCVGIRCNRRLARNMFVHGLGRLRGSFKVKFSARNAWILLRITA